MNWESLLAIIIIGFLLYIAYQMRHLGTSMQDDMKTTVNWTSDQIRTSNNLIGDVTEKLTTIEQSQKQVLMLTNQIRDLELVFKSPKKRGIVGEMMLEQQLKEILPASAYEMQYRFADGLVVDAVVKVGDMIIPIDAKFPLENFSKDGRAKEFIRDVKLRINETGQYVRESEQTSGFAFMYVPAQGVIDTLIEEDLIQYAFEHRVILVSPLSFFAYLQTVVQGLNALKIESKTKEILQNLNKVQDNLSLWQDEFEKVGKYLSLAQQSYEISEKRSDKLVQIIDKTLK